MLINFGTKRPEVQILSPRPVFATLEVYGTPSLFLPSSKIVVKFISSKTEVTSHGFSLT